MTARSIPPYERSGGSCRPLGLPMCQNRLAVPTWSYAMEIYPPARIIEIGTYSGGFTIGIAIHARQIGAHVVSFDRNRPDETLTDLARVLAIEFRRGDTWELENDIAQLIAAPGVSYLLCDGGDKRRELATFARHLKPGDVIAAHDYAADDGTGNETTWWGWSEIQKRDGDAVALACDLEPWLQDHFDTAAWLAYRRRPRDESLGAPDQSR